MTRTIRSLNKGRARVWWATHRQEAIRAAQLTTLVALFLTASTLDYQEQLDQERAALAAAREQLRDIAGTYGPPVPPTVFVIEARTPAELEMRLAEISRDLDVARSEMLGRRP